MKHAIISAIITLIVGIGVMAIFPETLAFGLLAAVTVMGACIIYCNDKKK